MSHTQRIAIFWQDGLLQYITEAETPHEAMTKFDAEIGIDPHDEGTSALCNKAFFYRVAPDAPVSDWDAYTDWESMERFLEEITH